MFNNQTRNTENARGAGRNFNSLRPRTAPTGAVLLSAAATVGVLLSGCGEKANVEPVGHGVGTGASPNKAPSPQPTKTADGLDGGTNAYYLKGDHFFVEARDATGTAHQVSEYFCQGQELRVINRQDGSLIPGEDPHGVNVGKMAICASGSLGGNLSTLYAKLQSGQ